ncbi:MAG: branched-chain amino acid aminotransferase [Alphaproteobacteria bacterium]
MGQHDGFGEGITYIDGEWIEGNAPLMGSMTHAAWLSSVVFDGARAIRRMAPDLDRHCARVIESAKKFGLEPPVTAKKIYDLAWEGIEKFPEDAVLYVRPMMFAEEGFVAPIPESTRFALVITHSPMPDDSGFTACISSFRRPTSDAAPTDAKASCLYPNSARALQEAAKRGFDNAVLCDLLGNVAEFATANLYCVKDGIAYTPVTNGTFLNGITRQRVMKLLRDAGTEVIEQTITVDALKDSDEIFSSGNYAKVASVTRIEDRDLQPGPVAKKAFDLYMEFAEKARR